MCGHSRSLRDDVSTPADDFLLTFPTKDFAFFPRKSPQIKRTTRAMAQTTRSSPRFAPSRIHIRTIIMYSAVKKNLRAMSCRLRDDVTNTRDASA